MNSEVATVEERVAAGVQLLDEKVPGWRDKIEAGQLSLASCVDCVIGQVFDVRHGRGIGIGPYFDWLKHVRWLLGIEGVVMPDRRLRERLIPYGMEAKPGWSEEPFTPDVDDREALEKQWKKVIMSGSE
jgi:hypothetical protein